MKFSFDDGGRKQSGFSGSTGDCVVRAVAIATELNYRYVYDALSEGCRNQRQTKNSPRQSSARDGVCVKRKWFREYMASLGWKWTATMGIGTGCKVHLRENELPHGRIIAQVSRHFVAVIDGVIHDTHDPSRWGNRCVYGYWSR